MDGDYLIYTDAGTHLISDPLPFFNLVDNTAEQVQLFSLCGGLLVSTWTKGDAIELLQCDEGCRKSVQITASVMVFKKSEKSLAWAEEYLKYCQDERILTDQPNSVAKGNLQGFRDHRHDQAVATILAYKHNFKNARDPTQWGENCYKEGGDPLFSFKTLISHTRDKTKRSLSDLL